MVEEPHERTVARRLLSPVYDAFRAALTATDEEIARFVRGEANRLARLPRHARATEVGLARWNMLVLELDARCVDGGLERLVGDEIPAGVAIYKLPGNAGVVRIKSTPPTILDKEQIAMFALGTPGGRVAVWLEWEFDEDDQFLKPRFTPADPGTRGTLPWSIPVPESTSVSPPDPARGTTDTRPARQVRVRPRRKPGQKDGGR